MEENKIVSPLNIFYFSVCLTFNKLYWIEDLITFISTRFYMLASSTVSNLTVIHADCSLHLETYILLIKADANRKHTKLDSKTFILFALLLSYLVNFTACFLVKFKKQFSHTHVVNSKIKEFNCEKARFIAIHTENDADMFILWHCIINARQNFWCISDIFLASAALS